MHNGANTTKKVESSETLKGSTLKTENHKADRIKIVFYTDPLCCWSWALLPQWQRFIENYENQIDYSYCMAGMIPDWKKFQDPFNSISLPSQMGPLWMEAQHQTGVAINDEIWIKNPPTSSYPACIAVKTAALQGVVSSELMLKSIWQAVMVDSVDISKNDSLMDLAKAVSLRYPDTINFDQFLDDYAKNRGLDSFREDLRQVAYHKVGRFPTLTFTKNGKGFIMTGYRPYEALAEAFNQLLPAEATI
jgi:putative protein-disulfide isomerase